MKENEEKRKKGKGKSKRRRHTKLGLKTDSVTDFSVLLHPYDVAIPPNTRVVGRCMESTLYVITLMAII